MEIELIQYIIWIVLDVNNIFMVIINVSDVFTIVFKKWYWYEFTFSNDKKITRTH